MSGHVFVWTVRDVIGLGVLGLFVLYAVGAGCVILVQSATARVRKFFRRRATPPPPEKGGA